MKLHLNLVSLFLLFFSIHLTAQEYLPSPRSIDKDYRSEYREQLKEAKEYIKNGEGKIQLPLEEMVPIEKLTPTEFSSSDFSNWGKTVLAPDQVMQRIADAAQYEVFFDCYDTGIDEDHPDMQVGKVSSRDGIGEPGGDGNGHGSHVWSTVMGQRGGLVYLLAQKGLLTGRATKVLSRSGSGTFSTFASMHETGFAETYKSVVDAGGFVVTNQSLGYNGVPLGYVENALKIGHEYGGITHVAAAGNSNSDVDYPGSSLYTLSVGAVDRNLNRASFSCYGDNLTTSAPGVQITACWKNGDYATISGTSMASPFVAGWCIAAYSIWGDKLKEPGSMESYLSGIVRDLGEPGRDDYYGFGLAVLNKIVDTEPGGDTTPPDDDDPDEPDTPDTPVDFVSTVTFEVDDEVFRYRVQGQNNFDLLKVDDLIATVSCICTEEEAYDLGAKTISDYFDFTAMVTPDTPEFGYRTTSWWVGQFLEYQARQKGVKLQVQSLKGTDNKGRNAIAENFDRAKVKSIDKGWYFGKERIDNVIGLGAAKKSDQYVVLQSLN